MKVHFLTDIMRKKNYFTNISPFYGMSKCEE